MYDKETFLKNVTVICDTREQENAHILAAFDRLKVLHIDQKLVFGDYSFKIQDCDFTLSCVIERKANINEFYGNLTKDRDRIEKEFSSANAISRQFTLLIENIADLESFRNFEVPDWEMIKFQRKVKKIGEYCYSTLQSWGCGNRYGFGTIFVENPSQTAAKILENFYWYWRNFKKLTASRRNK